MNQYQPGNLVTLTANFTNQAGVATDPTTITLRVTDPLGVETDYTYALAQITKLSVGQYSMALAVLTAGYWNYRWEGTGTVYAAQETRFLVSASAFPNPA